MSPEKARVFVAEDDAEWRERINRLLVRSGHEVVMTAETRQQAMEAVKRLQELGVQVATIDGNLRKFDSSGDDGQAILSAIREQAPNVKTVGFSALGVRGADANVDKGDPFELGEVVTRL